MYHDCTSVCEFRPGLVHCYASVANTCRGPKISFLGLLCIFDIVTPAQVSETTWRSQRGGSVMASYSSSAAARKSQVAVAIALTVCE